ncbi:MAG: AAA family ATPase, partial [Ilumatobacteraceae bacterium]
MSFIRLNGTDDLLQRDGPEGVHRLLAEITEIVDRASAELDVCWLETQAEANSVRWTLIAGAPTATERDGERLLRVLRRIADETPAPLRIGANLGVVFVGDMGHPQRCTYIVMGDATNLAARLMAKAAPGEIIAGERLHNTCPGRFEWTPLEPFTVKGKRVPVRAFVVGPLVEDPAGVVERGGGSTAPMVGRQAELAELLRVISVGGIVELVGEAGTGKTRLWQEARSIEGRRRWLVMRAEPHEVASLYLPFRRLIRPAAGIDVRADAAASGSVITAVVERMAPDLGPWLPLIATVVGADVESTDEVEALDPAFRADRLRLAVAELVVALTGPGSVIVFEDLHWVDEASRALLEVLGGMLVDGIALVVTRRPQGWSPAPVTTIELSAISGEQADQLLLRELPPSAASDATLTRLKESAAGNPLYLIELARSVATGTSRADGAYPETVERLLAARIDQLPIAGRELIRDASVLGSTMNRALAGRVLGRPDLNASETWQRELGDLVVLGEDTVRFRHDLVRVAAYEGLSVRRRRELHQRAGDVIEELGDSAPIADPIAALAFHASGSGLPERVVHWSREAAEAAMGKGAMEIAEWLLTDVVAAQRQLGSAPDERCAVHRRLALAAERAGHPESALDALDHAARMADEHDAAVIAEDRARLLEKLGRYRSALVATAKALRSSPEPDVSGHLLLARATIRNRLGQWKECLRLCRTLLQDSKYRDKRVLAQAHLLAEWCCMSLGLPERAEHERAAFSLLAGLDDSIGLGNLLLNRGESAWRECRALDAVEDFRLSSERYKRAGDVLGAALADNNLAEILTLQFHLEAAEELLTRARRVTQAAQYPHGTMTTISGLSRIAAWKGDTTRAL